MYFSLDPANSWIFISFHGESKKFIILSLVYIWSIIYLYYFLSFILSFFFIPFTIPFCVCPLRGFFPSPLILFILLFPSLHSLISSCQLDFSHFKKQKNENSKKKKKEKKIDAQPKYRNEIDLYRLASNEKHNVYTVRSIKYFLVRQHCIF